MNGTTTTAAFRAAILDPAKRAHYRLAWLSTVDHKRIAVLYLLTALFFFVVAGVGALHTAATGLAEQSFSQPGYFQSAFHHARHDDDFSRRHAGSVRVRKLRSSAADRSA